MISFPLETCFRAQFAVKTLIGILSSVYSKYFYQEFSFGWFIYLFIFGHTARHVES